MKWSATPRSSRRFLLVLLLVVLLPALIYSVYEINSLNRAETLMEDVYRRQLDAVLFSLNQYAWDVASTWASTVVIMTGERGIGSGRAGTPAFVDEFLARNASVNAVLAADSTGAGFRVFPRNPDDRALAGAVERTLRGNRDRLERMIQYSRQSYRKLEPIALGDSGVADLRLLIVFARDSKSGPAVMGFVIDAGRFVRDVLDVKLREAAGEEFVLAVFREGERRPLISTAPTEVNELRQRRSLWVLPGHYVGIRPRGVTIDELLRARLSQNLALILIVDVVLIAGAWFAYRMFRREMELVKMKSDFVSTVSHELRTPLALIRMYAETLEMGRVRDEDRRREYYATILEESERLSRLVNNILNFSRIEAGKKEYHFADVDLNDTVRTVLQTYHHHLETSGFSPVVELANDLPTVHADREAVNEAIINVLDNAVKYSRDEKYLRVATTYMDGSVVVEIADRGIGIAPEHHKRIFETFYRVSHGHVHDVKGSGLGLALVHHIMHAHGGRITLTSTPGKGSSFRLHFPVTPRT